MLLLASDIGNVEMLDYLLSLEEEKVDVSCRTADGKTGLHLAAIHDYREVAKLLIAHGVSLIAQDVEKDEDKGVGFVQVFGSFMTFFSLLLPSFCPIIIISLLLYAHTHTHTPHV